jgi:ADP-ribosylglycohydrolase
MVITDKNVNIMKKSAILLGLAIGDALGAPFENLQSNSEALKNWDGKTYLDSDHSYYKLKAGNITGDTGMSLALANSLIENKKYKPKETLKHYEEWFKVSPDGVSSTITKTMKKTASKWYMRGTHLDSKNPADNGTVMRIAPLAIWHAFKKLKDNNKITDTDHRLQLEEDVYLDSIITHKHPTDLTFETTNVYAQHLFNIIVKTYEFNPYNGRQMKGFIDNVIEMLDSNYHDSASDEKIKGFFYPNYDLRNEILRYYHMSIKTNDDLLNFIKDQDFDIISTVCSSVLCAALYKDNFPKAIETMIRSGGNTDTKAALTGALVAANVGIDGIPRHLMCGLTDLHKIIQTETLLIQSALL